jgi:hypothetical protein
MDTLLTLYTIQRCGNPLNAYYAVWINEHVFDYYCTLDAAIAAVQELRQ